MNCDYDLHTTEVCGEAVWWSVGEERRQDKTRDIPSHEFKVGFLLSEGIKGTGAGTGTGTGGTGSAALESSRARIWKLIEVLVLGRMKDRRNIA